MDLKEAADSRLTENAAHGVIRLGASVEACNDAACLILGRPREALIGASLVDLSPSIQADGTLSSERWARRLHTARAGLPQWFQWQFQKRGDGAVHALVHLSAAN